MFSKIFFFLISKYFSRISSHKTKYYLDIPISVYEYRPYFKYILVYVVTKRGESYIPFYGSETE